MATHGESARVDRSAALDLRVLEAIADGRSLAAVLSLIASGLEDLVVGWRVSILLISADGRSLHHGAAPSLPETYVRAIDGTPVGPESGSCGTAAHRRAVVIVEDIARDPLWEPYREAALAHGLQACWSVPVIDPASSVLATFAVYHATPAHPEQAHLELIRRFVHLAGIAIQHDRALREVRASEERFRTVFRDAALGLAVADPTGRFIHSNPAYQRMLGYSAEELTHLTIADVTHPEELGTNLQLMDDVRAGRRDSFVLEKQYLARGGRVLWARVTVSARRDASGRVTDTIALAEDITRERAAQDERQRQQSLLQMASRVGRLGAWSLDPATRLLHLSDELRDIHELEPGETLDTESLLATFAPEHQPVIRAAITDCITRGSAFDEEARLTTRRGTRKWVRLIGQAVRDERGIVARIQGALQDITDRKRLEQRSLRSQRLESIGTLAGGIAHDLNNVLTPIAMGVGLLKAGERDAGRLQVLDVMEQSATRAANMVQQVLSFARGAEGHRTRVAPDRLVSDVAALLADTLPKQIRLDISVATDAWTVYGDATQLHQVLLNLCVNARDAMPDGGTLRITVRNVHDRRTPGDVADQAPVPGVCISVEDTGEGIAPDLIDKIFDPFFTTKPIGRGTGLGLSTSLGIVHGHGGFIDVTSTLGVGSRFDVLLPAARQDTEPPASVDDDEEDPRGQGTILVVDDEPTVRLVSRRVLQRGGYRVLEAADGHEALDTFDRHQDEIAAVVTDMMMPGMDGAAVIRALRARSATVPIIGMSGIGISDRLSTAEVASLAGFLQKPYTPDVLLTALHRALHGPAGDRAGIAADRP
jgi:PAS domain S-box-containing protein